MYRKKSFGLEKVVEDTLVVLNTFMTRIENVMASFTNNIHPRTVISRHSIVSKTPIDIVTNIVATKVPRGRGLE